MAQAVIIVTPERFVQTRFAMESVPGVQRFAAQGLNPAAAASLAPHTHYYIVADGTTAQLNTLTTRMSGIVHERVSGGNFTSAASARGLKVAGGQ